MSSLIARHMEFYISQHILAHSFRQTVDGATSIILSQDFDLFHSLTLLHTIHLKLETLECYTIFTF